MSTAKKRTQAAKKAAQKKPAAPKETDEGFFGTSPDYEAPRTAEVRDPQPFTNHPRQAYAIKTLAEEVTGMFPETTVSFGAVDGRNTALAATFTAVDGLDDLLKVTAADQRVEVVVIDEETGDITVKLYSNPRTQDSRELFGLADAWMILGGESA